MQNKIRTAIFGGSFNPIHNGHIAIIESIKELLLADEVWLLVTPRNPWKESQDMLPDNLRLQMARDAISHFSYASVCDVEFTMERPLYTDNTLRLLSQRYPEREFLLTIGADNWALFHKWHNYQYILDNYHIIVYPRNGFQMTPPIKQRVTLLDSPLIDISSTTIRQLLSENRAISHLVPSSVQAELQHMQISPPSVQ